MKYKIVRYMTNWAIQETVFLFWKTLIRYGDYYDALPEQDGKVIEFETREEAEKWLSTVLKNSEVET